MGRASDEAEAIFQEAADLAPEQRDAFLRQRCADDTALLEHLRRLLSHLDDTREGDDFLERPISVVRCLAESETAATATAIPERLGEYRITRLIGEGGMGQVFQAEQAHPHRTVALKIIRPGIASGSMLARFEHEAEILGQLQHPGIAHIYQAGSITTPLGRQPFFAMEFIAGQTLVEFANRRDLGTRQRMELLARVCDAVEHAHHKGVIHRDLKPANILVDENGQPKILDFGVARTTGADLLTVSLHTGIGQLIGTVPYMSPEQVGDDSHQIDARSDVYALGVMLYELLGSRLPHDTGDKSIAEAARMIREEDPTRLSSLNPIFRGDIDTIVSKAIEKDKLRRYHSAAELAADIRRYLNDEPIIARPASTVYQLRKFARRNKTLVGGVATTFFALVAGIIGISILAARESDQRRLADLRAAEAQIQAYRSSLTAAAAAIQNADAALARRSLAQSPQELRGWEWRYLRAQSNRSLRTLECGDWSPQAMTVSADDRWLAIGGDTGAVRVWDFASGQIRQDFTTDSLVDALAFSPDSSHLLIAGRESVSIGSIEDGRLAWKLSFGASASSRAFHPDGSLIALGIPGRWEIQLIDVKTGQSVRALPVQDAWPSAVGFTADGTMLVCLTAQRTVTLVLDSQTGRTIRRIPGAWALSPDGHVLIGDPAEQLVIADIRTGEELVRKPVKLPGAFAINPARDQIASAESGALVLQEISGDQARVRLPAHEQKCLVAFAHQSPTVLTTSDDRRVLLWDARTGALPWAVSATNDTVFAAALSPDGRRAATAGWGGVKVWDVQTGAELWTTVISRETLQSVDFSSDGTRLVAGAKDGMLFVLDATTGLRTWGQATPFVPDNVCWVGNDRWIAVPNGSDIELIAVPLSGRDAATGARRLQGHDAPVRCLAVSRDRTLLASGAGSAETDADGAHCTVRVWNVDAGKVIHVLRGHQSAVNALAFDAQGTLLASGSTGGEVMLWDLSSGSLRARLNGNGRSVQTVAFTPDVTRVAAGFDDMTIRLWDVQRRFEAFVLNIPDSTLRQIAFTPDGRALLAMTRHAPLVAYELNISREVIEQRDLVHKAGRYVAALTTNFTVSDDLMEAIRNDATIPDALRSAAADLIRGRGDQFNYLNSKAWWIARSPGYDQLEYRRALRTAEAACRLWPDEPAMLNTLALLQYRTGAYELARATLDKSMTLSEPLYGGPHPGDLLVLAMAQHQLGEPDQARKTLEQARQRLQEQNLQDDSDMASLRFEAEQLLFAPEDSAQSCPARQGLRVREGATPDPMAVNSRCPVRSCMKRRDGIVGALACTATGAFAIPNHMKRCAPARQASRVDAGASRRHI